MPIKGRYKYTIYLDANLAEQVKEFLKSTNNTSGLSGFFNDYITKFTDTINKRIEDETIDMMIADHMKD